MTTATKRELTPMPKEYGSEDRMYKLKRNSAPLEFVLPSRNTHRFRLLHYDEGQKVNRALRFSENQRTPFEDEQDENVILKPIIFEKGTLFVPKNEPLLQWFLDLHPLKGRVFDIVDKKKEAKDEMAYMELQDQADEMVKIMSREQRKNIGTVLFQKRMSAWTEEELLVNLRKYARRNPKEFIKIAEDPEVEEKSIIHQFFTEKLLTVKFNNQIFLNLPSSRNKVLHMPEKSDKTKEEVMKTYFESEEGIQLYHMLEKELEERLSKKKEK